MINEGFDIWWYKNHPFDWWTKERKGKSLPHHDRVLVWSMVKDAYEEGQRAAHCLGKGQSLGGVERPLWFGPG